MLHAGLRRSRFSSAGQAFRKICAADFGALKDRHQGRAMERRLRHDRGDDLRGTREGIVLDGAEQSDHFFPGRKFPVIQLARRRLSLPTNRSAAPVEFQFPSDLTASEEFNFAPFGVQNEAALKSNWPDPAFRGAFLPAERSVRADGFDAKWKIPLRSQLSQAWTSRNGNETGSRQGRFGIPFGRSFCRSWTRIDTSSAPLIYGVLFLVLVFTTFFLFEVTARQKISSVPISDGRRRLCCFICCCCLFPNYRGWLCLSIAAVASTVLITWYCRFFLGAESEHDDRAPGWRAFTRFSTSLCVQQIRVASWRDRNFSLCCSSVYVTRKVDGTRVTRVSRIETKSERLDALEHFVEAA